MDYDKEQLRRDLGIRTLKKETIKREQNARQKQGKQDR